MEGRKETGKEENTGGKNGRNRVRNIYKKEKKHDYVKNFFWRFIFKQKKGHDK